MSYDRRASMDDLKTALRELRALGELTPAEILKFLGRRRGLIINASAGLEATTVAPVSHAALSNLGPPP